MKQNEFDKKVYASLTNDYSEDIEDIRRRVYVRAKNIHEEDVKVVRKVGIKSIIIVIIAAAFISFFVGNIARNGIVSGYSMSPTLLDKDICIVSELTDINYGDVISFKKDGHYYIKRVEGIPGDTICINDNGVLFVNNEPIKEPFPAMDEAGDYSSPQILGKDEYFVLGDNRNNSEDSRFSDIGRVHKDEIVGKYILKIFPSIKKIENTRTEKEQ